MKPILYWSPFSGSMAPMAVLDEVGIRYDRVFIDILAGEHKSPDYLKIHPLGLVPAYRLESGEHIFESAAITMLIADQHTEHGLAPLPCDPKRAHYNQWMLFLSNTVYPTFGRIAHPDWYCENATLTQDIKKVGLRDQLVHWRVIEQALSGSTWMLGNQFSIVDIYLSMLSSWESDQGLFRKSFPNISRVSSATAERPSVAAALSLHTV